MELVNVETAGIRRLEKLYGDMYRLEVEHFSAAILADTTLVITASSTIQNMLVIDACHKASETGKPVLVESDQSKLLCKLIKQPSSVLLQPKLLKGILVNRDDRFN